MHCKVYWHTVFCSILLKCITLSNLKWQSADKILLYGFLYSKNLKQQNDKKDNIRYYDVYYACVNYSVVHTIIITLNSYLYVSLQ